MESRGSDRVFHDDFDDGTDIEDKTDKEAGTHQEDDLENSSFDEGQIKDSEDFFGENDSKEEARLLSKAMEAYSRI